VVSEEKILEKIGQSETRIACEHGKDVNQRLQRD
jgi:hypothetical protein